MGVRGPRHLFRPRCLQRAWVVLGSLGSQSASPASLPSGSVGTPVIGSRWAGAWAYSTVPTTVTRLYQVCLSAPSGIHLPLFPMAPRRSALMTTEEASGLRPG